MGWIDDDNAYSAQAVPEGGVPERVKDPTLLQAWGAAFRQNNDVVSVARRMFRENYPPEEGYHPLKDIDGTEYLANHAKAFVTSRSRAETEAIKARIEQENEDRRINSMSGVPGVLANVAAGLLSPLSLLPGGALARAAGGGYSMARSALTVGGMAAVQAAASEGLLQMSQETRTLDESIHTISSAAILGGVLGAGAARFATRAERIAAEHALDRVRGELEGAVSGASLSAAAADSRSMQLVGTGKIAELINKTPGLKQVIGSPVARVLMSDSLVAKRAVGDLAETALEFTDAARGVTPATGIGPVDAMVRLETGKARAFWTSTLDDLWTKHYYNTDDAPMFGQFRADMADRFGKGAAGKLTRGEFNEEVSHALRNNTDHAIPEVKEAAQSIRKNILNPWAERMKAAGFIPEHVEIEEAGNYLHRMPDKTAFARNRPNAVKLIADWLEADQATKAGIQARLRAYRGSLDVAEEQARKHEARIAALEEDADILAARRQETTRVTKFAYTRAETLRESEWVNVGGVAVKAPGKNLEKARGGAPFETLARNRGNELADRASGKLAELDAATLALEKEIANAAFMRAKIEAELGAWEGKSAGAAKSAIKAREKYAAGRSPNAAGRLSSADDAVDAAVKKILSSDRARPRGDLEARANEIIDRIDVGPDGRLPYDEGGGGPRMGPPREGAEARGPMAERVFNIPDTFVSKDGTVKFTDFLENDIERILEGYSRSVIPDVLLHERFGDVEMAGVFRELRDEYAAKINAATTEKARLALRDERNQVEAQLAGIRDRVRHVYGYSPDQFSRNAARVAGALKNFNAVTDLGGALVSSFADAAGPVARWGVGSVFSNAWAPYIKHLATFGGEGQSGFAQLKSQMRAIGLASETVMASRMRDLDELADFTGKALPERALHVAAEKMQLLNLLAPWTDNMKVMAGATASSEILRAAKAVSEGKATAKQIKNLAASNISPAMAERVWNSWLKDGGAVVDGVHLPNTSMWGDKAAREAFELALSRETNIAVITPGQEKPLWVSKPVMGLIGQHKSFAMAATERLLLAGLQRRDAAVVQGFLMAMAMGALSRFSYSVISGKDLPQTPEEWVKEAIDRSGWLGSLQEINSMSAKATGGLADIHRLYGAGQPLSRYASRSLISSALGPSAGKVENLLGATGALGSEVQRRFGADTQGWQEADSTKIRRLMPYQNLFYIRRLLDKVEEGANGWAGID